jgi:hypothetical protein
VEHFFRYKKTQAAVWTQLIFKAFEEIRRHSANDTDVGEKVKKD